MGHRIESSRGLVGASVVIAVFLAACDAPTGPSPQVPLRITASIDRPVIARGETGLITFRVENVTAEPLVIMFGSSCQILPYVRRAASSEVVHPPGGGYACLTVLTRLELPAGGSEIQELHVQAGGTATFPTAALPPGNYVAYAMLGQSGAHVEQAGQGTTLTEDQRRSPAVSFMVL